jgi:four helix bundle protein
MDTPPGVPHRGDNRRFGEELEKRTLKFAVGIIKLSDRLPRTLEGGVVRTQITKAGTSIGANYREANRARSRADFKSKIKICEGEASETQYWLELIIESGWLSRQQIEPEFNEAKALLAIFCSVAKNS